MAYTTRMLRHAWCVMVMNAHPWLRRHVLPNYSMVCSSWQTAACCQPRVKILKARCRSMQLSRMAGVNKHPCVSDAHHAGPSRHAAAFIVEAQASLLDADDGLWLDPCPVWAQPCPCLAVNLARARSPFSISRDAFFRLHRVETSRPCDGRRSIRCNRTARAIRACGRAHASAIPALYHR